MTTYEIKLTGEEVLTVISILENSGSAALAVKVRDQLYAQRREKLASIGQKKEASFDEVQRIFGGFFK